MRRVIAFACVFALIFSLQAPAWAADDAAAPAKTTKAAGKDMKDVTAKPVPVAKTSGNKTEWANDHVRLGVAGWMSMGEGEWEITFEGFDPAFGFVSGRSKLEWEDIDANMIILFAEVGLGPYVSLGGSYGTADIDDGHNTDGDWLDLWVSEYQFSESVADTSGDTEMYDINLYLHLKPLLLKKWKGNIDLFIGYQHYEDDLTDVNGVQTIIDETPVNIPFAGLESTYLFKWDAARLGVRLEIPVAKPVSINAEAAVLFAAKYDGEGFWNLRDDFEQSSPNFTQEADSGLGADAKITVCIRPVQYASIDLGYRAFMLHGQDGTDTTYFSDGTSESTDFTSVDSLRHGLFGAVTFRF